MLQALAREAVAIVEAHAVAKLKAGAEAPTGQAKFAEASRLIVGAAELRGINAPAGHRLEGLIESQVHG